MLSREEILAVYEEGPEAVVSLVQSLCAQFEAQVQALSGRVRELEIRLSKDSHNSHKPPSSDEPSFRRARRKSLRHRSGKKPGGQRGHAGHTRLQVEVPDEVQLHAPACCAECGHGLAAVEPCATQRRQVVDLPALALRTTEHQAQSKCCPCCGQITQAAFPPGVKEAVQYGPGVLALGVYLQVHQLLPYGRAAGLVADLFGSAPSQGTLARALEQAHQKLGTVEEQILSGLCRSGVVHMDETGVHAAGKRQWLHSAGTPSLTRYRIHAKRGREALDAMGVLPGYEGVAVHDAYTSYLSYGVRHALCNAHLLRDLVAVEEETNAVWTAGMRTLLLDIKVAAGQAIARGDTQIGPVQVQVFRDRYDALLAQGRAAHPPRPPNGRPGRQKQSTAYNLVQRLEKHATAVLAFLYDLTVPFDNNLAERDLRMMKTQQKITGGFRTAHGAAIFCRIRGYLSTLRKQHLPVLAALRSVFAGEPLLPCFGPE